MRPTTPVYTVLRIMALWEYRRSTGIILTVASLMAFAGSCAAFAVGIHDMYRQCCHKLRHRFKSDEFDSRRSR